jgi:hypothetical protein
MGLIPAYTAAAETFPQLPVQAPVIRQSLCFKPGSIGAKDISQQ